MAPLMKNVTRKKIGIASSSNDQSTRQVSEWVHHLGGEFKVMDEVQLENIHWSISAQNDSTLNRTKSFDSFWYRRPDLGRTLCEMTADHFNDLGSMREQDVDRVRGFVRSTESSSKYYYWQYHFKHYAKNSIGNPLATNIDKMYQLQTAVHLGIDVPATLITGNKEELNTFFNAHPEGLIVKSMSDTIPLRVGETSYSTFSEEFVRNDLNALPPSFFPNLFQEKLDKAYEIRVFFLKGNFYSMAIFSQRDQQTAVDFRKYNMEKPNRVCRYQLPAELQEKLRKLMNNFALDTGSIDIVKTKTGRFVYLEVNPVGQFGMVSYPCNYQLEKIIANLLVNELPTS